HLQSLGKTYFSALDIVHFLDQSEEKARLKFKKTPSERTCRKWLHSMEYHFGKGTNGMYIDGHEREDVVVPPDLHMPGSKRIVLVTHDESTFYANDRRKKRWIHVSETPEPVRKGEGASIMVSDF
ncbi:hypothetical protein M422DRAFT_129077, partial [Sphaerobolus stellatus SS14]